MANKDCNHISPTTVLSLYHRRNTGIGYAEELARVSYAEAVARDFFGPELFPKMEFVAPILEAKYRAIKRYIDSNSDHNVLQLGCGLITHGLFVPDGVSYLGVDLPEMIEARRRIFSEVGVTYPEGYKDEVCDVLDRDRLEAVVRDNLALDRPILVVHESLLYHFGLDEKDGLIETFASLGGDYGLRWANTDVIIRPDIEKRLESNPLSAEILRTLTGKTGRDLVQNAYPSVEYGAEMLTRHGFEFDPDRDIQPLYTEGDFPINTLAAEGRERQMVLAMLSNVKTWMSRVKKR